jgi:hypothetical protein
MVSAVVSALYKGHLFKVCVAALLLSCTIFYLSPYKVANVHEIFHEVDVGKKNIFVEEAMKTEIDGFFDQQPMRELCGNTTWQEGLIFSCGAPQGGIGNVRNVFLNCVRYAIEGGGMWLSPLQRKCTRTPRRTPGLTKRNRCVCGARDHGPQHQRSLGPAYQQ